MTVNLAGTEVVASKLPTVEAILNPGSTTFKVTLECSSSLTNAQIVACTLGATVSIQIVIVGGMITYTGTISGVLIRSGYSMIQINSAVCTLTVIAP